MALDLDGLGTKVIQNVQTPVAAGTLPGFTPHVSIENVPNTDQTVASGKAARSGEYR